MLTGGSKTRLREDRRCQAGVRLGHPYRLDLRNMCVQCCSTSGPTTCLLAHVQCRHCRRLNERTLNVHVSHRYRVEVSSSPTGQVDPPHRRPVVGRVRTGTLDQLRRPAPSAWKHLYVPAAPLLSLVDRHAGLILSEPTSVASSHTIMPDESLPPLE